MSEYILEMLDIVKEFPGVRALKGVQLKVRPGAVHTLMGENGAGTAPRPRARRRWPPSTMCPSGC